MKLKPILKNTVVHTPTEAEAKELLAILHENGWIVCEPLDYIMSEAKGISIYPKPHWEWWENINNAKLNGSTILTLADFKRLYSKEEKPQPKFAVGDEVYQTSGYCRLDKYTVKKAYMDERGHWIYDLQGLIGIIGVEENNLCFTNQNPYTKLEIKTTEDMETKELNLCELLHEGDTVYSLVDGESKVEELYEGYFDVNGWRFRDDGTLNGSDKPKAKCLIFPSRTLYEQYPLDPYTAWMKWREEQKKHWAAVTAWIDDLECESDTAIDTNKIYFRTPTDRDKCIEEINAIISKYSK